MSQPPKEGKIVSSPENPQHSEVAIPSNVLGVLAVWIQNQEKIITIIAGMQASPVSHSVDCFYSLVDLSL